MIFAGGVLVMVAGLAARLRSPKDLTGPTLEPVRALGSALALSGGLAAAGQALTLAPAGHVGVVGLSGSVLPSTLKAGVNLVNPLARAHKLSVKTQEIKDVPSEERLAVQLEASLLFHLEGERPAGIYKTFGINYKEIVAGPQFRFGPAASRRRSRPGRSTPASARCRCR